MSDTYTLHVARDAMPGDPDALERAILVRDRFSWGAFILPALWFAAKGHWLLALLTLLLVIGFGAALSAIGVSRPAAIGAEMLLQLLIGLEAATLRRFMLARRGRPTVDVVQASSEAEAEARAFRRWLERDASYREPNQASAAIRPTAGRAEWDRSVLGLFPEPAARR
jgi:hypothetical protein